eukprot:GHVU01087849.1.p2 GENE.GHVU01087849.1~~GHVU01087849.1.p2  ORF type:complete len:111 (+),score=8.15 GHVU01087849.1:428-760(+)
MPTGTLKYRVPTIIPLQRMNSAQELSIPTMQALMGADEMMTSRKYSKTEGGAKRKPTPGLGLKSHPSSLSLIRRISCFEREDRIGACRHHMKLFSFQLESNSAFENPAMP